MNKLKNIFAGILIGAGVVLPGVSGSVIAIMLGIYDKVIYLINAKDVSFLEKLLKLMPILFGLVAGMVVFGNLLLILFNQYEIIMRYIFAGLILGGVPMLVTQFNKDTNCSCKLNYCCIIIAFLLSLLLLVLPCTRNFTKVNLVDVSFINLFLSGFLYISGKIIPGISSSFFLMLLGLYDYMLLFISNPFSFTLVEYVKFIPFVLGIIIGLVILIKLINYLLSNHLSKTYSLIVGFVLGSIFAILPGFKFELNYIISIFFMILSFILVNKLCKKS